MTRGKLVKPHSSESPEIEVEQIGSFSFPTIAALARHTHRPVSIYIYCITYYVRGDEEMLLYIILLRGHRG